MSQLIAQQVQAFQQRISGIRIPGIPILGQTSESHSSTELPRTAIATRHRRAPLIPVASLSASQQIGSTIGQANSSTHRNYSGTWVKDRKASDSMDDAMRLMHLGGIIRQAVKLVRGIQIDQTDTTFTMAVFSVISWFKVVEKYSLNGETSTWKRRDLRKGQHKGNVGNHQGPHGGLVLNLEWAQPYGGVGTDEFVMDSANKDELHIYSTILVDGQTAKYKSVYHRKR